MADKAGLFKLAVHIHVMQRLVLSFKHKKGLTENPNSGTW